MSDLEQRRRRRLLVLQAAYELTDGHAHKQFLQQDVERALGLSQEEVDALIVFLKNEGLLSLHSLGRVYAMTDAGVTEYQAAVSQPARPTRYFPAVNTIRAERVGQSKTGGNTGATHQTAPVPAVRPPVESPTVPAAPVVSASPEPLTETSDSAIVDALIREIRSAHVPPSAVEPPNVSQDVRVPHTTPKMFDSMVVHALIREIRSANIALSPRESDTLDSDLATVEAQLKRPQPMRSIISESFGSARTIVERAGDDALAAKIGHLLLEMAVWDF